MTGVKRVTHSRWNSLFHHQKKGWNVIWIFSAIWIVSLFLIHRQLPHSLLAETPFLLKLNLSYALLDDIEIGDRASLSSSSWEIVFPMKRPNSRPIASTGPIPIPMQLRHHHHQSWTSTLFDSNQMTTTTRQKSSRLLPGYMYCDEDDVDVKYRNLCRPPSWTFRRYPNCNLLHEVNLAACNTVQPQQHMTASANANDDGDSYWVNHGFYRDVWVVVSKEGVKSILKTTRLRFDWDCRSYTDTNREALIMERFTSSSMIVSAYGYCGTSVFTEAIPYEIEPYVIVSSGYYHSGWPQQSKYIPNDLTDFERLTMVLQMAESIALLHGYSDGVVVHSDVQLSQWLRSYNDTLVLGDFHSSHILEYNLDQQKYCSFSTGTVFGNYRSPEEFSSGLLDEKIDVYSLGNNIYALLTGLWVFYDTEDDSLVQRKVIDGERSQLLQVITGKSASSPIQKVLIQLMQRCWDANVDQRIDIFEVVQTLRQTLDQVLRLNKRSG